MSDDIKQMTAAAAVIVALLFGALGLETVLNRTAPPPDLAPYTYACRDIHEMFTDPEYLAKLLADDVADLWTLPPGPDWELLDLCIDVLRERFVVRR